MSGLQLGVVTPAYNQAAFLGETIDSVLNQETPIDYLVINDGSTDATEDVLARYGPRIKWRTQENVGQTATINRGWQDLTGNVVTWLNSDDTFTPGAARTALDYLEAHPDVDIVYGTTVFTDARSRRTPDLPKGAPFDFRTFVATCHNPIPQPSAFIRRRVLDHIGMLDEHYYYFMDWDYWLRAGLEHRIDHIPVTLSTYRLHDQSKTVAGELRAAPELNYAYNKFFSQARLPAEIRDLRTEAMAAMYFTMAGYRLRGGDARSARRDALRAVQESPRVLATRLGARSFAHCILGTTPPYRALRGLLRPQSKGLVS